MKKLWKFGWLGIGFLTAWLARAAPPSSRLPHEDWREAQRKAEAEKHRIRDAFDPQYSAAWRDLNARMTHYNLVDWGGIALIFASCLALPYLDEKSGFRALLVCLLVVAMLFGRAYFGKPINEFPCPRCGKPFIRIDPQARSALYDLHTSARRGTRCQNCKLPLWARNAEDIDSRTLAQHQIKTKTH